MAANAYKRAVEGMEASVSQNIVSDLVGMEDGKGAKSRLLGLAGCPVPSNCT